MQRSLTKCAECYAGNVAMTPNAGCGVSIKKKTAGRVGEARHLRDVMSGTRIRQKFAKKRSLHRVNEHFSQIFNAIIVPRSSRAKVSKRNPALWCDMKARKLACGMRVMGGAGKEKARLREGNRACVIRGKSPGSTAGCGKPHVRWCGRGDGRNPITPTRSRAST
jgi:hypothetical protein